MQAPARPSGGLPAARIVLELPSRREACETARLEVDRFLAPWQPDAAALFAIELVLEEVLMNIIWHAHADAPDAAIVLSVEVQDQSFRLRFEDQGRPFDPTAAAPPTRPATLEDARPGGLGIALLHKFAHAIDYERAGGRNCLTVTIAR